MLAVRQVHHQHAHPCCEHRARVFYIVRYLLLYREKALAVTGNQGAQVAMDWWASIHRVNTVQNVWYVYWDGKWARAVLLSQAVYSSGWCRHRRALHTTPGTYTGSRYMFWPQIIWTCNHSLSMFWRSVHSRQCLGGGGGSESFSQNQQFLPSISEASYLLRCSLFLGYSC